MIESPGMTLVSISGQLICLTKTWAHFSYKLKGKELVSVGVKLKLLNFQKEEMHDI